MTYTKYTTGYQICASRDTRGLSLIPVYLLSSIVLDGLSTREMSWSAILPLRRRRRAYLDGRGDTLSVPAHRLVKHVPEHNLHRSKERHPTSILTGQKGGGHQPIRQKGSLSNRSHRVQKLALGGTAVLISTRPRDNCHEANCQSIVHRLLESVGLMLHGSPNSCVA